MEVPSYVQLVAAVFGVAALVVFVLHAADLPSGASVAQRAIIATVLACIGYVVLHSANSSDATHAAPPAAAQDHAPAASSAQDDEQPPAPSAGAPAASPVQQSRKAKLLELHTRGGRDPKHNAQYTLQRRQTLDEDWLAANTNTGGHLAWRQTDSNAVVHKQGERVLPGRGPLPMGSKLL